MRKKKKLTDWFDKLTNAEQYIWRMIYYNPTMILSRTEALNMMFCCIGTGIKWNEEGELRDTVTNNYMNRETHKVNSFDKNMMKKAYINTFSKNRIDFDRLYRENTEWMRAYAFYENCVAKHTLKNIEKLVTTSHVPKYFYPICKYSNIMTIPKNVKPDWLELAIETCNLVLATDPTLRDWDDRLFNENNIKLMKKQKVKLLKMKK